MMKKCMIMIMFIGGCHPAFAESPCDYNHNVDLIFTKQIDKTENIDRKVFPYIDDTRKCIMTMDITIEGVSYPAKGEFVFGPDVAENVACENATQRAKTEVIQKVSPEILSAATNMKCEQKNEMPEHVAAPPPQAKIEKKEVVINEQVVQQPVVTERVVSRTIVVDQPNYVTVSPPVTTRISNVIVTPGYNNQPKFIHVRPAGRNGYHSSFTDVTGLVNVFGSFLQ